MITCSCYWCASGKQHPKTHTEWETISDYLLVNNSLKDEDRIKLEACVTCSHTREKENNHAYP